MWKIAFSCRSHLLRVVTMAQPSTVESRRIAALLLCLSLACPAWSFQCHTPPTPPMQRAPPELPPQLQQPQQPPPLPVASLSLVRRHRCPSSPHLILAEPSGESRTTESRTVGPDSSLGRLSDDAASIRCPFWRTRAYDALESALSVANFVAARHKSFLDRPWRPGSESSLFEPLSLPPRAMGEKTCGLTVEQVMDVVRDDMELRAYYVTGRLTSAVYSDACFFDSPDPDMPVKSLARYCDALRGLFDPSLSAIDLLGLEKVCERSFVAHWRLSGALKLPWRPQIKPYLGVTLYELDESGLIVSHNEEWSISALEAFGSTLWPALGIGGPAAPEAGLLQRDESLWRALDPPAPRVVVGSDGVPGRQHQNQ